MVTRPWFLSIAASKQKVCDLEQNRKDLEQELESSKSREAFLHGDLTGLFITYIYIQSCINTKWLLQRDTFTAEAKRIVYLSFVEQSMHNLAEWQEITTLQYPYAMYNMFQTDYILGPKRFTPNEKKMIRNVFVISEIYNLNIFTSK